MWIQRIPLIIISPSSKTRYMFKHFRQQYDPTLRLHHWMSVLSRNLTYCRFFKSGPEPDDHQNTIWSWTTVAEQTQRRKGDSQSRTGLDVARLLLRAGFGAAVAQTARHLSVSDPMDADEHWVPAACTPDQHIKLITERASRSRLINHFSVSDLCHRRRCSLCCRWASSYTLWIWSKAEPQEADYPGWEGDAWPLTPHDPPGSTGRLHQNLSDRSQHLLRSNTRDSKLNAVSFTWSLQASLCWTNTQTLDLWWTHRPVEHRQRSLTAWWTHNGRLDWAAGRSSETRQTSEMIRIHWDV